MKPIQKPHIRTDHFPFKTCSEFDCVICTKGRASFKVVDSFKSDEFFGASPAPFISKFGYPDVNVGILTPPEVTDSAKYDAPRLWASKNTKIPEIINYRSSLVNSRSISNVKNPNKIASITQEVGLASKPVDVEIDLEKKPSLNLSFDSYSAPIGPAAYLKNARITQNATVPFHVEKVFSDTDLLASEAISYLFKQDYDENYLSQILSVGSVGLGKNRKMVPTRWSITATDDIIGKNILNQIRDFNEIENFEFYFDGYLGNYFVVLIFPYKFGYELFETFVPDDASFNTNLDFTTDHELFVGRKDYVSQTAGGYYASRLPIISSLLKRKKQGSVVVIRIITQEYKVPLGVWVVREATRKSIESKPTSFQSKELMIKYLQHFTKNKFGIDINQFLIRSKILDSMKQKSLSSFI